jgi:hypothetical protein
MGICWGYDGNMNMNGYDTVVDGKNNMIVDGKCKKM